MEKKFWGASPDGSDIYVYTISNHNGMSASTMNFGGNLLTLNIPDASGRVKDVVLGYQNLERYFTNSPHYGCCVEPYANRISNASFTINDITYSLDKNDGENCLHSGNHPLHRKIWNVKNVSDHQITYEYQGSLKEMGFPGNLVSRITYTITEENELRIDYYALSDADTAFNPTNHSYFNLNGHNSGTVLNHELTIYADSITPSDNHAIPDGSIRLVEGTPMDFRKPKKIGQDIDADYDQLINAHGYDHNYNINPTNSGEMTKAATLHDFVSGRTLEVFTTLPGMHVYTGNFIDPNEIGKEGTSYAPRDGICFETQYYPNAINIPTFAQPILKANEEKTSTTIFRFSNN